MRKYNYEVFCYDNTNDLTFEDIGTVIADCEVVALKLICEKYLVDNIYVEIKRLEKIE